MSLTETSALRSGWVEIQFRIGIFHLGDQGVDPGVEARLPVLLRVLLEPMFFALQHFEVVRYLGHQEDVRQARV